MGYIALYRKYRPQNFEDIVGQEHVTKILKNQINTGKISHAYIFCGTRGTGKTSAAKVFSRAINCLNPKDGEPCNECEVCKSILEGNTTDVVEMDAASNNSVENIRQIRQEVMYATVDVKYRVYIIDEAHMLTTSAFNALLKTLEEPPANVIFILATTESHKIPVTILSRCLRFDFGRLSEKDILRRLEYICKEEKIDYEEEALSYISKLADGALRDGISILDRCISENDTKLLLKDVKSIVGAVDDDILNEVVENVYNFNAISSIECIDKVIAKGKDLRYFVSNLVEKFLNCLISEKDEVLKSRTISIIDRLSRLDNELKGATSQSVLLKAAIVELCNNQTNIKMQDNSKNSGNENIDMLNTKIKNLENQIITLKENMIVSKKSNNLVVNSEEKEIKKINPNTNFEKEIYQNIDVKEKINSMETFEKSDEFKKYILQKGNIKIYSAIASAKIYERDSVIVIMTLNSFAYNLLSEVANINIIKSNFKEKYGKDVIIKIGLNEKNEDNTLKIEQLFKEKDVNYTKID